MSANFDYDPAHDDEGNEPDDRKVTLSRSQIRTMEKDAKEARALREQNEQLARKVAMAEAGIPLDHPRAKFLADVESTPEALKAAAAELGIFEDEPSQEAPAADPQADAELAAHAAASAASSGAPAAAPDDPAGELERMHAAMVNKPWLRNAPLPSEEAVIEAARKAGVVVT
jgi:hypothetical protein